MIYFLHLPVHLYISHQGIPEDELALQSMMDKSLVAIAGLISTNSCDDSIRTFGRSLEKRNCSFQLCSTGNLCSSVCLKSPNPIRIQIG